MLAAEPEDLNSIPRSHVVEGENRLPEAVLRPPHDGCGTHTHTHLPPTVNKCFEKKTERGC